MPATKRKSSDAAPASAKKSKTKVPNGPPAKWSTKDVSSWVTGEHAGLPDTQDSVKDIAKQVRALKVTGARLQQGFSATELRNLNITTSANRDAFNEAVSDLFQGSKGSSSSTPSKIEKAANVRKATPSKIEKAANVKKPPLKVDFVALGIVGATIAASWAPIPTYGSEDGLSVTSVAALIPSLARFPVVACYVYYLLPLVPKAFVSAFALVGLDLQSQVDGALDRVAHLKKFLLQLEWRVVQLSFALLCSATLLSYFGDYTFAAKLVELYGRAMNGLHQVADYFTEHDDVQGDGTKNPIWQAFSNIFIGLFDETEEVQGWGEWVAKQGKWLQNMGVGAFGFTPPEIFFKCIMGGSFPQLQQFLVDVCNQYGALVLGLTLWLFGDVALPWVIFSCGLMAGLVGAGTIVPTGMAAGATLGDIAEVFTAILPGNVRVAALSGLRLSGASFGVTTLFGGALAAVPASAVAVAALSTLAIPFGFFVKLAFDYAGKLFLAASATGVGAWGLVVIQVVELIKSISLQPDLQDILRRVLLLLFVAALLALARRREAADGTAMSNLEKGAIVVGAGATMLAYAATSVFPSSLLSKTNAIFPAMYAMGLCWCLKAIKDSLCGKAQHCKAEHTIFVLDRSGSMYGGPFRELEGAYNAHNADKKAGKAKLKLEPHEDDQTTIILFNHEVASNDTYPTNKAPKSLGSVGGGTRFRPALEAVEKALARPAVAACEVKTLVFMSDGEGWDKHEGMNQMCLLHEKHPDLRVQTVAFGDADALTLNTLASIGGGTLHTAAIGTEELDETFRYISGESTSLSVAATVGAMGAALAVFLYRFNAGPFKILQAALAQYAGSVGLGVGVHGVLMQTESWPDEDGDGTADAPADFARRAADSLLSRAIVLGLAVVLGLQWSSYFYSKVTLLSIKLTLIAAYPICYGFLVVLGPLVLALTKYVLPFNGGASLATGTPMATGWSDAAVGSARHGLGSPAEMLTKWTESLGSFAATPFSSLFLNNVDFSYVGTEQCSTGADSGCIPEWTLPLMAIYMLYQLYRIPLRASGITSEKHASAATLAAAPWRHMLKIGAVYALSPWFDLAVRALCDSKYLEGEFTARSEGVRLHSDVIVYAGVAMGCFEWAAEAVSKAEITTVDSITALFGSAAGLNTLRNMKGPESTALVSVVCDFFKHMPYRFGMFWGWLFQHYNRLNRGTDYNRFLKQSSLLTIATQFFKGTAIPKLNE